MLCMSNICLFLELLQGILASNSKSETVIVLDTYLFELSSNFLVELVHEESRILLVPGGHHGSHTVLQCSKHILQA